MAQYRQGLLHAKQMGQSILVKTKQFTNCPTIMFVTKSKTSVSWATMFVEGYRKSNIIESSSTPPPHSLFLSGIKGLKSSSCTY
jgi:hypothetical protein